MLMACSEKKRKVVGTIHSPKLMAFYQIGSAFYECKVMGSASRSHLLDSAKVFTLFQVCHSKCTGQQVLQP